MTEQVPSEELVAEVELTPEQEARASQLQHDIWCDADALDAAREIIHLRDRVRELESEFKAFTGQAAPGSKP